MPFAPVVGDRYFLTWEELGSPTVKGDIEVPGLGWVFLDDADVHYAQGTPGAGFFVRKSKALGTEHFVVVARQQSA